MRQGKKQDMQQYLLLLVNVSQIMSPLPPRCSDDDTQHLSSKSTLEWYQLKKKKKYTIKYRREIYFYTFIEVGDEAEMTGIATSGT